MNVRPFHPTDLDELKRITIEAFDGTSVDQIVEQQFGIMAGHDWRWRKARHIDQDCAANPAGAFVAEENGKILGYVTTVLDREAGKGRIPNLAVDAAARGRGIGRQLIDHALDYFRSEGMAFAAIETMDHNPAGQHLYPACGFVEMGRQIQYAMKL